MKFIGDVVKTGIVMATVAAAMTVGINVAETVWENGMKDKVADASKKLFRK